MKIRSLIVCACILVISSQQLFAQIIFQNVPGNLTISCEDEFPEPDLVSASSTCPGLVDLTYDEHTGSGQCFSSYTVVRSWTATDNCGTTESISQVISVEDNTPPEFTTFPVDVTIMCAMLPALPTPEITATDNCDPEPAIIFTETTTGACPESYTINRSWQVVDACGNIAETTQAISVVGTEDNDWDDDNVPDEEDNCPETYNPGQVDLDGDGIGDVCDNCMDFPNPYQEDEDNNTEGDACICNPENSPLPFMPGNYTSVYASFDGAWTHFCDGNGYLLLSLLLENTGAVIPVNGVQLNLGAVMASYHASGTGFINHPSGGVVFNRRWEVLPAVQPNSNVGVRFYFLNDEYEAVNTSLTGLGYNPVPGLARLQFYKVTTSAVGVFPPLSALNLNNTIVLSNSNAPTTDSWVLGQYNNNHFAEYEVSSFSGGGGGGTDGGNSLLPIELISFKGKAEKTGNQLTWRTANEEEHFGFEVQRKKGNKWIGLGFVQGKGTGSGINTYTFFDEHVLQEKSHYRLAQLDVSGKKYYSDIVVVERSEAKTEVLLYPNPVHEELTLVNAIGEVRIYNSTGNIVKTLTLENYQETIQIDDLPSGAYSLEIKNDETLKTKRFLKL